MNGQKILNQINRGRKIPEQINRGRKIPKQINRGRIIPKQINMGRKIPEQINMGRKIKKLIHVYRVKASIQFNRIRNSQTKLRDSFPIGVYKPVFLRDKDKSLTKSARSEVSQIFTGSWLTCLSWISNVINRKNVEIRGMTTVHVINQSRAL